MYHEGEHLDGDNILHQNGDLLGPSEEDDTGDEDDLGDDMERASSSPSITDGVYPQFLWPRRSSSLSYSPSRSTSRTSNEFGCSSLSSISSTPRDSPRSEHKCAPRASHVTSHSLRVVNQVGNDGSPVISFKSSPTPVVRPLLWSLSDLEQHHHYGGEFWKARHLETSRRNTVLHAITA
jgi:hypothetical protein